MPDDFKPQDRTSEFDSMDIERNKVVCGLSYLGILFFLPLVACPDSMFGKFHANQALIIFIAEAVVSIAGTALRFMPFTGWSSAIIGTVGGLICGIFALMGLIFAFQGKAMEMPIIGSIKIIK